MTLPTGQLRVGTRFNARDPGADAMGGASLAAVDPETFGAVGDGITNDSTAIQNAFNSAAATTGIVRLSAATYIATGLTVPAGIKLIYGDGNDVTILKRPDNASTSASILTATGRSDFQIADLALDGNKANQTRGGHNLVLSSCSDFQVRRVRSVNAKAVSGYGSGFVLDQLAPTNTTGREQQLLGCEAYENDSDGVTIQRTGAGISVRDCLLCDNGDAGLYFYDQNITPAAGTVPAMLLTGNRCERNASAGIAVLGFFVSGLGGVKVFGHGASPVARCIIDGNQCNWNASYGIFAQGAGITISSNGTAYNGSTNQAGICCNAEYTLVTGNQVQGNKYFGIDFGGSRYGRVSNNAVWGTDDGSGGGTGINLGACQHVECADNDLVDNGTRQISVARYDAGTYWFAWDGYGIAVRRNRIIETRANTNFGIWCEGQAEDILIEGNDFAWPDTVGYNCIRANIATGRVQGNRLTGSSQDAFLMNVGATLTLPEWADALAINSNTAVATGIQTRSQQLATQTIAGAKLTSRGSGYSASFQVIVTGGGGSGAEIWARVSQDGQVAALQIITAGTGFTGTPTLDFSNGDGTGAAATALVGIPILAGRHIDLIAYGTDIRIQAGAVIKLPGPTGTTLTLKSQGILGLRAAQSVWYPHTLLQPQDTLALEGSGTPEGAVTAPVGSTFRRSDGGASTSFYVKESGTGNTGWVAK